VCGCVGVWVCLGGEGGGGTLKQLQSIIIILNFMLVNLYSGLYLWFRCTLVFWHKEEVKNKYNLLCTRIQTRKMDGSS